MINKSVNSIKSKLIKLKLSFVDLENKSMGVKTIIAKMNNQLSALGVVIAETGSKVSLEAFNKLMTELCLVQYNLDNKFMSVDEARLRLLKLRNSELFKLIE